MAESTFETSFRKVRAESGVRRMILLTRCHGGAAFEA